MNEDYCSFEIAKLLKEKGFDVKPYHQYYVSSCGKVFGCKGNELKQTTTNDFSIWCEDSYEHPLTTNYPTYEEAVEAAIKYSLENLI